MLTALSLSFHVIFKSGSLTGSSTIEPSTNCTLIFLLVLPSGKITGGYSKTLPVPILAPALSITTFSLPTGGKPSGELSGATSSAVPTLAASFFTFSVCPSCTIVVVPSSGSFSITVFSFTVYLF